MTLQERIDSDLKDAMRAKDALKLGVLRMLKSAMKYSAIEKAGATAQPGDAEVIQAIRKQVKQRQDSIESFEKGGRPELAAKVRATIGEVGATSKAQMGEVMKALQAKLVGRADGKALSQEVQRQLG